MPSALWLALRSGWTFEIAYRISLNGSLDTGRLCELLCLLLHDWTLWVSYSEKRFGAMSETALCHDQLLGAHLSE